MPMTKAMITIVAITTATTSIDSVSRPQIKNDSRVIVAKVFLIILSLRANNCYQQKRKPTNGPSMTLQLFSSQHSSRHALTEMTEIYATVLFFQDDSSFHSACSSFLNNIKSNTLTKGRGKS